MFTGSRTAQTEPNALNDARLDSLAQMPPESQPTSPPVFGGTFGIWNPGHIVKFMVEAYLERLELPHLLPSIASRLEIGGCPRI